MNQPDNKTEQLSIIIQERKSLGIVCLPYILDTSAAPVYRIVEPATPIILENSRLSFSAEETELIKTLHGISDQSLFKKFSKEKTVKGFYEKLQPNIIENNIRPFIDKTIAKAIPLISSLKLPVFYKSGNYSNLYETDEVEILPELSKPRFYFSITPEGELSYTLKIIGGGEEFTLKNKHITELSTDPAILLINKKIHVFRNIDSKKFKPFLLKNRITFPERSVEKYMQTFVKNCITHHYVSAFGFSIHKQSITCKPILNIILGLKGYNFQLVFAYGENRHVYNTLQKTITLTKENNRYVFLAFTRQKGAEEKYMENMQDLGLKHIGSGILTNDDIGETSASPYPLVQWVNANADRLSQMGIKVESCKSQTNYYLGSVGLNIEASNEIDWFGINGTVVLEGVTIPFIKLKRNILDRNPEYTLPDGSVLIIPDEWFTTWADIMTFANVENDKLKLDKIHATLLPQFAAAENGIAEATTLTPSTSERCGELKTTLRPYQEDGFRWMQTLRENHRGGILADDMGLGKTIQTIALLSHVYATAPKRDENTEQIYKGLNDTILPPSMIVVPVSLMHNWINEIRRFAPQLKVYVYNGPLRAKSFMLEKLIRHYHVLITSYGLLRNDTCYFQECNFYYMILDESQYVKNPASKTYHAVMKITAEHKLNLSGTPIENRLADLWAQMNIINPSLLGGTQFFRNYFETPIAKCDDKEREEKLKKIIAPFILRRTKEMVANDLPPITYQTIACPMTDDQRRVYESEISASRNEILNLTSTPNDAGNTKFIVLQALTRLRLIANHPLLIDNNYEGSSGKLEQVLEQIENVVSEGHKILIFSSFVRDLELLSRMLDERKTGFAMLTGKTKNREAVIDDFLHNSAKKVFLISLKAGGVGLNLTGADYVFVLNPWWNPAAEMQAISRAHRIGQTKSVFVYRFITTGTIEEDISKLQEKKQQMAGNFITATNIISELTTDEISQLIINSQKELTPEA